MFPFDSQFLNLKLRWQFKHYVILDWDMKGAYHDKKALFDVITKRNDAEYWEEPFQISLKETLEDEFTMLQAWIDFRINKVQKLSNEHSSSTRVLAKDNAGCRFALIRLRVERNPADFMANTIFPFFIIVACGFSVYGIDSQAIGERLSVSVTILLTFAAFQSVTAEQTPRSSAILLIDYYIGFAYLLQFMLIAGTFLTGLDAAEDYDMVFFDNLLGSVLAVFWILFSFFYMSLRWKACLWFYNKVCCCCLRKVHWDDWESRAEQELILWKKNAATKKFDKQNYRREDALTANKVQKNAL